MTFSIQRLCREAWLAAGGLFLALLLAGCSGPGDQPAPPVRADLQRILTALNNPGSDTVLVAAHRGAHLKAPENSIPAIRGAIDAGADIVELDVRTTSDGHLVLMHDSRVDRTTSGSGPVRGLTLEQVKALRFTGDFAQDYADEQVPTFEEALRACWGNIVVDLDWKDAAAAKIVEALRRTETVGQVLIFTRDFTKLDSALALDDGLMVMPRARSADEVTDIMLKYHPRVVHIDDSFFTAEVVSAITTGGARVWINALGKPDLMAKTAGLDSAYGSLTSGGANIIQTDQPGLVLQFLRSRGQHW